MGIFFCLLIQVAASIMLLSLPKAIFGIPHASAAYPLNLWLGAITSVAVPASLMILSLTRGIFIRLCSLAWGFWVALLSAWLLVKAPTEMPGLTTYGTGLIGGIFVFSLGLVLFSIFSLTPKRIKQRPIDSKALQT